MLVLKDLPGTNNQARTFRKTGIFKTSPISQCRASDTIRRSQNLMYKVMDLHNPRAARAPSGAMTDLWA